MKKIASKKKESDDVNLIKKIHEAGKYVHLGVQKTLQILKAQGIKVSSSAISEVVTKCLVCQTYKHSTLEKQGFLTNFDIPHEI
jgi:Integrase zinc binding domain